MPFRMPPGNLLILRTGLYLRRVGTLFIHKRGCDSDARIP